MAALSVADFAPALAPLSRIALGIGVNGRPYPWVIPGPYFYNSAGLSWRHPLITTISHAN